MRMRTYGVLYVFGDAELFRNYKGAVVFVIMYDL